MMKKRNGFSLAGAVLRALTPGRRVVVHHPDRIPIQSKACRAAAVPSGSGASVRLRFMNDHMAPLGSFVEVTIWALGEAQTFVAQVVSCDQCDVGYDTQVRFPSRDDAYRARIVEQICHIEAYRSEVREQEGRKLRMDRAAEEWIEKNAAHFPAF